jgi:membrane fusion protein, copper/silver efflux system
MNRFFKNKYLKYVLFGLGGLFLGWLIFHSPTRQMAQEKKTVLEVNKSIWTCAMHPQIRMSAPGKCPLCGMELILLNQGTTSPVDSNSIILTPEAAQLANVEIFRTVHQKTVKEIRLYGKVQLDERLIQSEVANYPGRIEKLLINFTGEEVHKGQVLAIIYSPELVTAQQELLETIKSKQLQPELYSAAKEKLRLLKLSESQISAIENSGETQPKLELISNATGFVKARRVNNGDYVQQGTVIYDIADSKSVWIIFDAYESDLMFLKKGDTIAFRVHALPGTIFSSKISYIDPVIDPVTRTAKIRAEINNSTGELKSDMFVTGTLNAILTGYQDKLVIPRSSVLWTGNRSIVYVRQKGNDEPVFTMREIELGPMLNESYIVISGLKEGEQIVTHGTFSIDAAAQLEGKPSMMNHPIGNESNIYESKNTESITIKKQ